MSDIDEPTGDERSLLAALGEAIADPMPPGLVARAAGLLAWTNVDGELAELLSTDERELAGTRGGSTASPATLEFLTAGGVGVEVVVEPDRLSGQVLGAEAAAVTVEHAAASATDANDGTSPVDADGQFEVRPRPTGVIRLRIDLTDHGRIHTDWFVP